SPAASCASCPSPNSRSRHFCAVSVAGLWRRAGTQEGYHLALLVVSTGARSAERRDLLSTTSGLSWKKGLSARPFGPWSRRRRRPCAIVLPLPGAVPEATPPPSVPASFGPLFAS